MKGSFVYQPFYDEIVAGTGCSQSNDTLQCLRGVDYDTLKAEVDKTKGVPGVQGLAFPFSSRVDGTFLTDLPQNLISQGSVANIPVISGNMDDEGTIYVLTLGDVKYVF